MVDLAETGHGFLSEHQLEPISRDDLGKRTQVAPQKAASGREQWRPHDWAHIPDESLDEIL